MLKRLNGLKVSAKALFKSRDTEPSNYEGTGSSHKGEGQATPPQKPDVATNVKRSGGQDTVMQPNFADSNDSDGKDHVPLRYEREPALESDPHENQLLVEQYTVSSSHSFSTPGPAPSPAENREEGSDMIIEATNTTQAHNHETTPNHVNKNGSCTPPTESAFANEPQEIPPLVEQYKSSSLHITSIPSSASTTAVNGEVGGGGQFKSSDPGVDAAHYATAVHTSEQAIMANGHDEDPQVNRSATNSPWSSQGNNDSGSYITANTHDDESQVNRSVVNSSLSSQEGSDPGSFTYSVERRAMEVVLATSTNEPERQVIPGRAFQGARGFVMNNPIFFDTPMVPPTKAMKLLSRNTIFGASLNSNTRFPPPSCLKGTRLEVRNRILTWVTDMNRESNLLWLYGPAGAGISAICQTTAQHCKRKGWLGAAFFFPRIKQGEEDPTKIIPSLAYQLATTYPTYKDLITSLLNYDHSVLEEALPSQFEKLIIAPLSKLTRKRQNAHPILILLDGLDACPDPRFQREFIRQVGGFATATQRSRIPVVWIIATRREWQMTASFESMGPHIRYRREELRIDTEDAKQDVQRFLRDGFKRVRQTYGDAFLEGSEWPAENQLSTVDSTASGLFAFANDVVNFVDSDDPVAKMKDCLEYLENGIVPQSGNPLHSLHILYQDILGAIQPDVFRSTKRILSFLALGARGIPAQDIASFLSLDQSTFYGSLRRLHSVMEIPAPKEATESSLAILHTSFGEYLRHRIESGYFDFDARIEQPLVVADMERYYMTLYTSWKDGSLDRFLTSNQYDVDREHNIMKFAMQELWAIWSSKRREEISKLCTTLRQFDFSDYDHNNGELGKLAPLKGVGRYITALVCLLTDWPEEDEITDGYPVLRLEPRCETDQHLFREYREVMSYLQAKVLDSDRLKSTPNCWSYRGFSLKRTLDSQDDFLRTMDILGPQTMYFFLGHGANTCLVFAC